MNYSIIIPHHNIPELLKECLESLPTSSQIEIIIVDDNSSPENVTKIKQLEDSFSSRNIKWIYDKKGGGAGYARNIGLKEARGEWIIFVDADDLLRNAEEIWEKAIEKNPDSEIIFFDAETTSNEENDRVNVRKKTIKQILDTHPNKLEDYLKYSFTEPWAKLFNASFLKREAIIFQESYVANDYMFSVRSGYSAKEIAYYPESFYIAVARPNSLSNSALDNRKLVARLKVYLSVEQFFQQHNIRRFPFSSLVTFLTIKYPRKIKLIKEVCKGNNIKVIPVVINSFLSRFFKISNKSI